MAGNSTVSGEVLTVVDRDVVAARIDEMWRNYNVARNSALSLSQEVRAYIFGTDIDQTSASILPHMNRTHQPKLTQLSDTLQTHYYEASLSMPQFFRFYGETPKDRELARFVENWVRSKLEQKKFRETIGRQLVTDYVLYGNCFAQVNYINVVDDSNKIVYKGPAVTRISPMDIVVNPRAESFRESIKIIRKRMHIAKLAALPEKYPQMDFNKGAIAELVNKRQPENIKDWVETLVDAQLEIDGYSTLNEYFNQDMAEVLMYYGDVYNPDTGESQQNRIVYVVDRTHVILNIANPSPTGFDSLHHGGWRVRSDNIWAQGPLDNLVGMQYRIDHLENLKADVFDLIAHPNVKVKGENVMAPEEGFAPGAIWYMGVDEDVELMKPDASALSANNEIGQYHRMMEDFAGAPPESRGIRTPGEKTAFEVDKLDRNAAMFFVDKARNFERLLETVLREIFELMLVNYDGKDYIDIFDDPEGEAELKQLSLEDVSARGEFQAVGARHWSRRNRESQELLQFMQGPLVDPKVRAHVDGFKLASLWERKLNLEAEKIVDEFAGVKEDAHIKAVGEAELAKFNKGPQISGPDAESAANQAIADGSNPANPIQPQQGSPG